MPETLNHAGLVAALRDSGLLTAAQLAELPRLAARHAAPGALTGELIRRGWLTAYQAGEVARGRARELMLGSYVLLEPVGSGGMGRVFKARHCGLGRVVAVKILLPELVGNELAVGRFLREVQAAAGLSHPNIVRAFDAGRVDGRYYFAMEFIDGRDLARTVKEGGPLPPARACDYVRQAALGLQHAHERGLVHRDIKPHNLLVAGAEQGHPACRGPAPGPHQCRWGVVKILDMGLARILCADGTGTALTQLGAVMGTPDFIAPEQARDSHATDTRGDIYSLGCTLYYLLAGRVPFPAGSVTQRLLAHQLEEPEPVEEVRREQLIRRGADPAGLKSLSSRVGQVVRRMMAKRPEDRFQTPGEAAEALAGILAPGASEALRRTKKMPRPGAATQPAIPVARPAAPTVTAAPAAAPPAPPPGAVTWPPVPTPPAAGGPIISLPPSRSGRGLPRRLRQLFVAAGLVALSVMVGRLWF